MSQTSYADILRLRLQFEDLDAAALKEHAEFFGYGLEVKKPVKQESKNVETAKQKLPEKQEDDVLEEPSDIRFDFPYFFVEKVEGLPQHQGKADEDLAWLFDKEDLPTKLPTIRECKRELLYTWNNLKHRLLERIHIDERKGKLDTDKVISKITKREPLTELPKLKNKKQSPQIALLADYSSEKCRPLFQDFVALAGNTADEDAVLGDIPRLFSSHYVHRDRLTATHNIGRRLQAHRENRVLNYLYAKDAVIVISDLGLYEDDDSVLEQWLEFAEISNSYSCKAIALLPVPLRYVDRRIAEAFDCICIETGRFIDTVALGNLPVGLEQRLTTKASDLRVTETSVLSLLATVSYIDSKLLRASRSLFDTLDVATEVLAWSHEHVKSDPESARIEQESLEPYLTSLEAMQDRALDIRNLILDYHSQSERNIEQFVQALSGIDEIFDIDDAAYHDDVVATLQNLVRDLASPDISPEAKATLGEFLAVMVARFPDKQKDEVYASAIWSLLLKQEHFPEAKRPLWVKRSILEGIVGSEMSQKVEEAQIVYVQQTVDSIRLLKSTSTPDGHLIELYCRSDSLLVEQKIGNNVLNTIVSVSKDISLDNPYDIALTDGLTQMDLILSEQIRVSLALKNRPSWAKSIEVTKNTPIVRAANDEETVYHWEKAEKVREQDQTQKGFWYPYSITNPLELIVPSWGTQRGKDNYGPYVELNVGRVRQRFRWIEPGEFLMGSSDSEPERDDDEQQHTVRLTEGYWIADTACTQALWQEVMSENPSHFKGGNLPVEQVSWVDAVRFINKLNDRLGALFALPTEAQWEYACRAGTTTPFSFGETISSEKVNFDGSRPYDNGQTSEDRQKTVEVASLPANDWGLYEMHGNVLEWCTDWFDIYDVSQDIGIDPIGPETGEYRVLRGGSWRYVGRLCRSAVRDHGLPDVRLNYLGFRLVSGHLRTKSGSKA